MSAAFESDFSGSPSGLRHPVALAFSVAWRAGALLTYVFANSLNDSYIVAFLLVLTFLSLDFWTVKNVSGRLLVGLRWWNVVDAEGKSHWRFEARKENSATSALERRVFWAALVATPVVWVLLALLSVLRWQWLVVAVMGAGMSGANLWGYLRCKWSSRQELSSYLSQTLFRTALSQAASQAQRPQQPTQTV